MVLDRSGRLGIISLTSIALTESLNETSQNSSLAKHILSDYAGPGQSRILSSFTLDHNL
jgi:hypothetical protein